MPSNVSESSLFLSLLQLDYPKAQPLSFNNTTWYWKQEQMEACGEGGESSVGAEVSGVVVQTLTQQNVRPQNNTL